MSDFWDDRTLEQDIDACVGCEDCVGGKCISKGGCFSMIPLLDKKYSIIYADPPWNYRNRGTRAAAVKHYDTMSVEDIKRMGVGVAGGIANEDCVLFMWATFPLLQDALDVINAWGFNYKTIAFNWIKQNKNGTGIFMGLGNWTRSNSEICLLATKGNPKRISNCVRSVILSPLQRHSRKPVEVRDRIVELMGDLPRIELFARETAPGWDAWGNEVLIFNRKENE